MAKIIIFGAVDLAKLVDHYLTTDSEHTVAAYTVDAAFRTTDTYMDRPLVDFEEVESLYSPNEYKMIIAITYGKMNQVRAQKYAEAKAKGYELISYVSSKCSYLSQHPPGDNCIIMEDNTIQPFVQIGDNVVMWSGNHIGHDSIIGDHVFITSHVVVSGWCRIKPYCFLGVNATLRNGITLGSSTLVGAGAAIMHDTEPESVYVPPKAIKIDKKSTDINL